MTIGDLYNNLKEIAELEHQRDSIIRSRILNNKFLSKDEMEYIRTFKNIPINENSSGSDKRSHDEIENINKRIELLKNIGVF